MFYLIGNLSQTILNKARKSIYDKDKVFVKLYNELEYKNFYKNNNLLLVTPFVNERNNIDHSTLYIISKLFELLHADIADLQFLARSAVDPKTLSLNSLFIYFQDLCLSYEKQKPSG